MLDWVLGRKKSAKKRTKNGKKKPSYEEAKRVAAQGDAKARAELASHEDLEPEFLYYFATDEDAGVRRAVAKNDGSPLQADLILAKDVDQSVREELAFKIGRLVPTLTDAESEQLAEMTFQVLEILAQDQVTQVRAIISDEIKHLHNIPRRLIKRLAEDAEITVAGPILEYSPLLTDEQILQIITSGLRGGALEAVARRQNLSARLSKAVVDQEDDTAISELLKNQTAKINEKLMDEIALHAETRPDLHLPLVDRRSLSKATLKRIATFVSAALVERMISSNKMEEKMARELRLAVRERIDAGEAEEEKTRGDGDAKQAEKLFKNGKLDEYAVLDAIDEGNLEYLQRSYELLTSLPTKHISKMLTSGSAKGLCALAWKAGHGADIAVSLQRRIGKIPAKSMIHEAADGSFQMPEEELEWYVDYFK
ncbi:MAG: DUF2336 domain-containing protein [Rhodospirillales bacterium]|nr:DUF2336 domain-containing protein [Rhodospirillales bacterium]MBO6786957.1 DUF2336 domain-containing protein [Rhodospirillales bacterium]